MKRNRILLLTALMLFTAFFTGTSYAWFANKRDGGSAQVMAAKIDTKLAFELNTNYGVPGEVINIIAKNSGTPGAMINVNALTNMGNRDYIFKITYTVSYDSETHGGGAIPYIIDMKLADAGKDRSDGNVLIEGSYSKETSTLVCYGRHYGQSPMDLGELHAEFNTLKKTAMSKPFTIEAEVEACQATAAAVKDIFGISASDTQYTALFPTTP